METIYLNSVAGLELEMLIQVKRCIVKERPWYLKLFLNPIIKGVHMKGRIKSIGTNFIIVEWEK